MSAQGCIEGQTQDFATLARPLPQVAAWARSAPLCNTGVIIMKVLCDAQKVALQGVHALPFCKSAKVPELAEGGYTGCSTAGS